MPRLHLFEWEDQSWLPKSFRQVITDTLSYFVSSSQAYRPVVKKMAQALQATNENKIIDLCSGSGGTVTSMQRDLREIAGYNVKVVLTDKFPNLPAYRFLMEGAPSQINYRHQSVDALAVPRDLKGFRTMFTAFHHFKPSQAKAILGDAVRNQSAIGIFEFTERNLKGMMPIFAGPAIQWLSTPFFRPFSWTRLLWTYLIPIGPIVLFWDGMVSCLRSYSPRELAALTKDFPEYQWDIGKLPGPTLFSPRVTFLIGYPKP